MNQMSEKHEDAAAIQVYEPKGLPSPREQVEIESQIATAKHSPRSITEFRKELVDMACHDEETAASCFYGVPREGKTIEGPSIRLAELALSAYRNCIVQGDVSGEDEKFIYAIGMARDLEKNIAARVTVRRRITKKDGSRFNDDMIAITANAAVSIAVRNAIFRIIPGVYIKDAFRRAKQVAIGDAKTLVNRRADAFQYLQKMGATSERVLSALGKKGIDDVSLDDLGKLLGFVSAIREGEAQIDDVFPAIAKKTAKEKTQAPKEATEVKPETIEPPDSASEDTNSFSIF